MLKRPDTMTAAEIACRQRLADSPYAIRFRGVGVRIADGKLVLDGVVASFFMKQMLQTLFKDVEDRLQIVNRVEVAEPGDRATSPS